MVEKVKKKQVLNFKTFQPFKRPQGANLSNLPILQATAGSEPFKPFQPFKRPQGANL
jgi:hypothetical protein